MTTKDGVPRNTLVPTSDAMPIEDVREITLLGTIARQALPNFPFGQATTGMSTNSTESTAELAIRCHANVGHLIDSPEESVVRYALSSGEVP